jgi:hypothetical protein
LGPLAQKKPQPFSLFTSAVGARKSREERLLRCPDLIILQAIHDRASWSKIDHREITTE